MAVKKWSNVYAKTQARQGVVMLAVEKVDPHDANDSRWTCVDPVLRVQVVNLRNRQIYTLRPQAGIQYAPMVGLSNEDKSRIEKQSWDVVCRTMGIKSHHEKGAVVQRRGARRQYASGMISDFVGYLKAVGVFGLT